MADTRRLRRSILLLCAVLGVGVVVGVAAGLVAAGLRIEAPEAVPHLVLAGMIAGGVGLGLAVWLFFRLDAALSRPLAAIAHRLELAASDAEVGQAPVERSDPGMVRPLADAAGAALAALETARHDRDAATASATRRIEEQRRRLEAVIRDLQEGVIVCSSDHRVLLCNRCAVAMLHGEQSLGLGRRIDRVLTPEPLRHAIDRLVRRRRGGEQNPTTTAICGTLAGDRTLQCQVSLLPEDGDTLAGFILSFRDVTGEIAHHAERDRLLRESLEVVRRLSSGLYTTLEMLVSDDAMAVETRRQFEGAAAADAARLAEAVSAFAERSDQAVASHWPLTAISSDDIVASAVPRIAADTGLAVAEEGPPVWLRSDGSSLVQLVCTLAGGIAREKADRVAIRAVAEPGDERAYLDLCWRGEVMSMATLDDLLEAPPVGHGPAGREILDRHRAEIWPDREHDGRARLRIALRQAAEPRAGPEGERPEFYDFEIAASPEVLADERRLDSLSYVVFDTETTGLQPSGGDRIVQIAGVRIVNGRLLGGEVFDSLVQPGRRIPALATEVHGISDAMVAGAPPLEDVLRRFHAFASEAVLVAHNAAFDMAFLRRDEGGAGVAFENPVLDTVLLSAFLEPESPDHTLDGLSGRYGIAFREGTRHTALGDAQATARLFLAMLPLLDRRGVRTLGEAVRVSEQASAIRRQQSRY